MKNIFRTAGAILAAGAILSACGSKTHYGWNGPKLYLPHVGFATAAITTFAHSDPAYVKQAANPKDWVHSNTFGRYIFVGPYTSGADYRHVRDSKIEAMDWNEFLKLVLAKSTRWPQHTINGFNYVNHKQFSNNGPASQILTAAGVNAAIQWQIQHHFTPTKSNVPSEATIIESPVGELAPPKTSKSVPGACIPSPVELVGNGGHSAPNDPLNFSPASYVVQYSSLSSNLYAHGTTSQTASCTKALSGAA